MAAIQYNAIIGAIEMATRKKAKKIEPMYTHPHWTVFYEMKHGKDEIVPGTPLKFKYERGVFLFVKMVHHEEKNVTWIDCKDKNKGVYRSFYIEKLMGVIKPKKKRKKRVENV